MKDMIRPTLFERILRVYNSDRFLLGLVALAGMYLFYVCVLWEIK